MSKGILIYGEAQLVDSLDDFDIGWISPTGQLFDLEFGYHSSVAQEIVAQVYGICWLSQFDLCIDAEDYLIEHGWVKITLDVQAGNLRAFSNSSISKFVLSLIQALGAVQRDW